MSVVKIDMAGECLFAPLMKPLFGGSSVSGGTTTPPKPRVVRMPTNSDPSVLAAGQRARSNALRSRGRLSTILTDMTRGITGSGGKLGA